MRIDDAIRVLGDEKLLSPQGQAIDRMLWEYNRLKKIEESVKTLFVRHGMIIAPEVVVGDRLIYDEVEFESIKEMLKYDEEAGKEF